MTVKQHVVGPKWLDTKFCLQTDGHLYHEDGHETIASFVNGKVLNPVKKLMNRLRLE